MTPDDSLNALDKVLEHVSDERRDFLKRILGGAAVAAMPLILSEVAAQPPAPGKGVFKGGAGYLGKGGAPGYVGKGGGRPGYAGKGGGPGYVGKGGGAGKGRR